MWSALLFLLCSQCACGFSVKNDIEILESLYNSWQGANWNWRSQDVHEYFVGNVWNFTKNVSGNYISDPCRDKWQGVCCEESANVTSLHCDLILQYANISKFVINSLVIQNRCNMSGSVIGLVLPEFNLVGNLVPELFLLTCLSTLVLQNNKLNGSLPLNFDNLTMLSYLDLQSNIFNGDIPSTLFDLHCTQYLLLNDNELSGPLSGGISKMITLTVLEISFNYLSHTIPSEIRYLSALAVLDLEGNLFSGTIPNLAALTGLTQLYLSNNYVSGGLPSSLGSLLTLTELSLFGNILTGSLPAAICEMTSFTIMALSSNQLVGNIPECIGNLRMLVVVKIQSNLLSGVLPDTLGDLAALTSIHLMNNHFTGSFPVSMRQLISLETLLAHSNHFTGRPGHSFSVNQTALYTLDLCDNSFSGTVPVELFKLPSIGSLAMMKNCFSGHISEDICDYGSSNKLNTVIMDGLASGTSCQTPLFLGTYSSNLVIGGRIPTCLFALPHLVELQLSGNQLAGSITPDLKLMNTTRYLSLAHNELTGTIPSVLQKHPFNYLDLSYNRLSGTTDYFGGFFLIQVNDTDLTDDSKYLILQVNGLTGYLPASFSNAQNIQVVNGNMFGCNSTNGLPAHDPYTLIYQCGSGYLNESLFTATAFILLLILLFLGKVMLGPSYLAMSHLMELLQVYESYAQKCADEALVSCMPAALEVHPLSTRHFLMLLGAISRISIVLSVLILFTFLPFELVIKVVKNQQFSSHTFQYAYAPSLCYIVGGVPAVILTCILIMFMVFVYLNMTALGSWLRKVCHEHQLELAAADRMQATRSTFSKRFQKDIALLILFPLLDILIILCANGCYLYIFFHFGSFLTYSALLALVAFKLAWNSMYLPRYLAYLQHQFRDTGSFSSRVSSGFLLSCLMLFNNIMIPCIVTLCTDPNCFLNVFVPANPVSVNIPVVNNCIVHTLNGLCIGNFARMVTLEYNPSFAYNFECSSSALATYVPVFVLMYTYLGFIAPLLGLVAPALFEYASNMPQALRLLSLVCSPIMRSKDQLIHNLDGSWTKPSSLLLSSSSSSASQSAHIKEYQHEELICGEVLTASFMCHLVTLLTFGAAYPILAVLIAAAIVIEIRQWRFLIGRYLWAASSAGPVRQAAMLRYLENSCLGVAGILRKAKWLMLFIMSLFYSFFLLDMTETKTIKISADVLWFPAVLICWPVAVWLVTRMCKKYSNFSTAYIDNAKAGEHEGGRVSRLTSDSRGISMKLFGLSSASVDSHHSGRMQAVDRATSSSSPFAVPISHDL